MMMIDNSDDDDKEGIWIGQLEQSTCATVAVLVGYMYVATASAVPGARGVVQSIRRLGLYGGGGGLSRGWEVISRVAIGVE